MTIKQTIIFPVEMMLFYHTWEFAAIKMTTFYSKAQNIYFLFQHSECLVSIARLKMSTSYNKAQNFYFL